LERHAVRAGVVVPPRNVDAIGAVAHEAIVSRDWATGRRCGICSTPISDWTGADGVVVRGRNKELGILQGDHSALAEAGGAIRHGFPA